MKKMIRNFPVFLLFFMSALVVTPYLSAEEKGALDSWPPVLTKSEPYNGRFTDWYQHGTRPSWKCVNSSQRDTFTVMHPKTGDGANCPLYVVLHSAGHDVFSCMNCTKTIGNHDIYRAPDGFYALYVDCRANQSTDWWWGGPRGDEQINDSNRAKFGIELQPVEKRLLDTIKWVIEKYRIDVNRVYLCGNSMGGSGTLGFGLRHGDIFAAIKANVPAGVLHASARLQLEAKSDRLPDGTRIPDPPICLDYSAQNDRWSGGHEILCKGMKDRRYSFIAYWGNFGHANNSQLIEKVNDLINTFDWTSIRKNAAYPVFTNASTDDSIPWPNVAESSKPGQINAFFRWKNKLDSANRFEMELELAQDIPTKVFTIPKSSGADVTLRRLQQFRVQPGESVKWTFAGKNGTVKADSDGLVTIPRLTVAGTPAVLTLVKQK